MWFLTLFDKKKKKWGRQLIWLILYITLLSLYTDVPLPIYLYFFLFFLLAFIIYYDFYHIFLYVNQPIQGNISQPKKYDKSNDWFKSLLVIISHQHI